MTDVVLRGLSPRQLAALGDTALLAGDFALARAFYERLVAAVPSAANTHARLALAQRPSTRSRAMLKVMQDVEADVPNSNVFVGEGLATWLKLTPFLADSRFMQIAEQHADLAPAGVAGWHWNLQTVLSAAQQARALPGDFVELGVYKGHTTRFLAEYLDFGGWDRRWWLYDTFEGIPEDQRDAGREHLGANVYGEPFDFTEVRDRFSAWPNIVVTKGRVPEILHEVCPERIAFMHIDLNNAVAEVAALDLLYDRLAPGGVVVLDDFAWGSSHAQNQAETAWFAKRGLTVFTLPTGQGLFIKPPTA